MISVVSSSSSLTAAHACFTLRIKTLKIFLITTQIISSIVKKRDRGYPSDLMVGRGVSVHFFPLAALLLRRRLSIPSCISWTLESQGIRRLCIPSSNAVALCPFPHPSTVRAYCLKVLASAETNFHIQWHSQIYLRTQLLKRQRNFLHGKNAYRAKVCQT